MACSSVPGGRGGGGEKEGGKEGEIKGRKENLKIA